MEYKNPVFEKLDVVDKDLIETWSLLEELSLSRSSLQRVHEYVEYWVKKARERPHEQLVYPSYYRVKRVMNKTCDRGQEGGKRTAVFSVPEEYRGIGLMETQKEFTWTCIVTTLVEVSL